MYNIFTCLIILLLFSGVFTSSKLPAPKVLKCAVCRSLVSELHNEMDKVDSRKTIDVGSFRIESDGNQKVTSRPYAGSEAHMTEVLETVCGSFKDYVQAYHKETGAFEVITLIGSDGNMNPRFGEYEAVQDPDLNKGVEYQCQNIVEDYEDQIIEYFSKLSKNYNREESQSKFCNKATKLCTGLKDEL